MPLESSEYHLKLALPDDHSLAAEVTALLPRDQREDPRVRKVLEVRTFEWNGPIPPMLHGLSNGQLVTVAVGIRESASKTLSIVLDHLNGGPPYGLQLEYPLAEWDAEGESRTFPLPEEYDFPRPTVSAMPGSHRMSGGYTEGNIFIGLPYQVRNTDLNDVLHLGRRVDMSYYDNRLTTAWRSHFGSFGITREFGTASIGRRALPAARERLSQIFGPGGMVRAELKRVLWRVLGNQ